MERPSFAHLAAPLLASLGLLHAVPAAAEPSAADLFAEGERLFGGHDVEQDIPGALDHWKRAAAAGHGRAASTAAMAYLSGEGIEPDAARARRLAERAVDLDDPAGLVVLGEMEFQVGAIERARGLWTRVSKTHPVRPSADPEQSWDEACAQMGADLVRLIDLRRRPPEPGRAVIVRTPHVLQGFNNCGATSCAILARSEAAAADRRIGGWDYKRLCPSPLGTGTDWGDLVAASRKIGRTWKLVTFTPDERGFAEATACLRSHLDAGRPVVVDFKYTGPRYPNGEAGHTLCVAGYVAAGSLVDEDLYVLCNPAVPTPGLQILSASDLARHWRSDHYGEISNDVLSRPAIVIDAP